MKFNGPRLVLWSLVAIFLSSIGNFEMLEASPIGKFVGQLLAALGSLAWIGLIAGGIWNFIERKNQPEAAQPSATKFWIGFMLVAIGMALPSLSIYQMLFVPGGADAIFILMIFGPICLGLIIWGGLMMVRNRKARGQASGQ